MKKSFLFFLCFASFVFNCFGQKIYKEMADGSSKWVIKISERHFNENGKSTYFCDEFGGETWNDFDKNGNLIHSKNSDGIEIWYDLDSNGNVIHLKDNFTSEIWSDFDDNGNKIGSRDQDDFERWWEFDEDNRLLTFGDSSGFQCWYSYDDNGNLAHKIDALNNESFFDYDKDNHLIHVRKVFTDSNLETESFYKYDKKGNLIYENENSEEYWYEYDKNNSVISKKDNSGFSGKYKYDYKIKYKDDSVYDTVWYNDLWYEPESVPDYLIFYENSNNFSYSLTYDKYGHITKYEDNIGVSYFYEYEYYKDGSVKAVVEYSL